MAVYAGATECKVIYVTKGGVARRVSSVWVGDQQVFPPANRQEIHAFTRDTQGYGREEDGTSLGFSVPVPWWAASMDVVMIGAGEKGRDGTKSFSGGSDGAGGKSGAWVVKTVALPESTDAVVRVGKGTSTTPAPTGVILQVAGASDAVTVHDGEGTRTANSGSTGGRVTPDSRTEFASYHVGGSGGSRNNPGQHPGGGGGGGQGSNLLGNPREGQPGGDGYVWLRFRSAPALNHGGEGFILRVGVTSGWAYEPLRAWAVGIGKTHQTITEITVPLVVVAPSLYGLFYGCHVLTGVPELDTSQVTNMNSMFYECHALTSVPELNTSQVTDTGFMFYGCTSLESVPELNTSQVTGMRSMFYSCSSLTSVPDLDTSKVTDMPFMFYGCHVLTGVPELDTSQVTNMYAMFYECHALTSVPELDTSQVADTGFMFYDCPSLESVPELNTSQVTGMRSMFNGCSTLTSVPDLDTSKVTDMYAMFGDCSSLVSVPALDTRQVTEMQYMFYGCSSLTSVPDLDTSKVTNMPFMFYGCHVLTTIPALNTSQVTNVYAMFSNCSSLESVTLPGMGRAFTSKGTLDMKDTKLNAAAANALMQSLGTVPRAANGTKLELPSTAAGADTSIAASKNWTVTIG